MKDGAEKMQTRMKSYSRIIALFLAVIMSLGTLSGCHSNKNDRHNVSVTEENKSLITMDVIDGKKVITDCLGRRVEIPENIEKISAMHIYGVKMIYAMQLQDKAAFKLGIGDDFKNFAALDPSYAALPDSPAQGNGSTLTEALLSLGVNVVLTNANNGPEEADTYANAGMAAIAVRGETFEEVYETAKLLGFVFNKQHRAEELVMFIDGKLKSITDKTAKLSDEDKPSVMLCGPAGVYTCATKEMFQNEMIETAGGINAGAKFPGSKWAKIGAEDIIEMDPDCIILSNSCTDAEKAEVLSDPALQSVKAIKNKAVYIFPSTLGWWDFPLPQSILGISWLSTVIQPEIFKDIDIKTLADEVYEFMYGYTYTELGGEV